jgi:hypothetical protein
MTVHEIHSTIDVSCSGQGGKPILPQCNYQYFHEKGWPFMNRTSDIVDSLLAPFEFPQ